MKEEIEKEFHSGLTRECKKGNNDCIAKQHLLYPNREREIGEIHCFILFCRPIRYIRRGRNKEREEKKKETKREREIGENHWFTPFRPFPRRIRRRRNGERETKWGKSLFHYFQSFAFIV